MPTAASYMLRCRRFLIFANFTWQVCKDNNRNSGKHRLKIVIKFNREFSYTGVTLVFMFSPQLSLVKLNTSAYETGANTDTRVKNAELAPAEQLVNIL